MRLFTEDDWAQDHHDIEVMGRGREGAGEEATARGSSRGSTAAWLIGQFLPEEADAEVVIGIETDRGPWVAALIAAGYTVYPVNPLQALRYRERHGVSGAKSDGGDAHMLADMLRTDSHWLRAAAGDSAEAEGIKVLARTHKTLIWERTWVVQRLRHPDAETFLSQPGMARVLAESGDDPHRYATAKARKNYAATGPITRASGKKKIVAARFARNDRLVNALNASSQLRAHVPGRLPPGDHPGERVDDERDVGEPAGPDGT